MLILLLVIVIIIITTITFIYKILRSNLYLKTDGVLTLKQRRSQVQNVVRRRLNDLIYQQCVVNLFSHHLWNMDNVGYMHCPTSLLMHFQTQELSVKQTIAKLQEELDNINTDDTLPSHLEEKLKESRLELEKIIEFRTKGAILRSKTRWYNEGEKNTKYFLNLEKRHYKQGTISQIKLNNRDFVTLHEEILTECVSFYKNLYSSKGMTYDQNDTTFFS